MCLNVSMAFKPSPVLVNALTGVPLLSECSKKEVRALASEGKVSSKKAGSTIIAEGMKGIAFFLVLDGTVDISREERPLARLMAGDFFGEAALLSDRPRNATAVAVTDVEMFTFTQSAFKTVLLGNAKLAYGVARALATRIDNT